MLASCLFAQSYQATILPPGQFDSVSASTISGGIIAGEAITDTGFPAPGTYAFQSYALLWQTPQSTPQNLHPAAFYSSRILASYGSTFAGTVSTLTDTVRPIAYSQAAIWTGPSHDFVNLHPVGFQQSRVSGCWGDQQAGTVYIAGIPAGIPKAALWTGTAASFVNLHPVHYVSSYAEGIWGNQQVGAGDSEPEDRWHALLWQGTASSVIDLHPAAFTSSTATDVWNGIQVGAGSLDQFGSLGSQKATHALLWSGSAANYVDLHPDGFFNSRASAICGDLQVGYGLLDGTVGSSRALLWNGSAQSVINLHDLLPSIYVWSEASDVDEFGNIVGTAYLADGTAHAVYWQPIPEPSMLVLLGLGAWRLKRR